MMLSQVVSWSWRERLAFTSAFTSGAALSLIVTGRAVTQGVLALAFLLALGYFASHRRWPPIWRADMPMRWAVLAIAVLWLPSLMVSIDTTASVLTWMRTFIFVIGAATLWALYREDPRYYRAAMIGLLAVGAVLIPIAAFKTLVLHDNSPSVRSLKPAASALVVLVPLFCYVGWRLGQRWRWAAALIVASVPAVVLNTGSRASLAGMAVGILVILAVIAIRQRRLILIVAGLAVAAGVVGAAWKVPEWYAKGDGHQLYLPAVVDAHRQIIWRFTFGKFLERPIVGWGINSINESPGAGERIPGMQQEFIPAHPHSWLVELSAETGLVGFVPFVATLLWLGVRLGRRYVGTGDYTDLAALAVLAVFWSSAAFNFSIWAVWWQLMFLISFALLNAGERNARP